LLNKRKKKSIRDSELSSQPKNITAKVSKKNKENIPQDREIEKENAKREKELNRQRKQKEKDEQKKEKQKEKESEKKRKEEERKRNKKKTPDECLQEIIIHLDVALVADANGGIILSSLQQRGCKLQFQNHLTVPCSVEWVRVEETKSLQDLESQMEEDAKHNQPNQILIRFRAETFLNHIKTQTLYDYVKKNRNTYAGKTVMYLLEGLNEALKVHNREGDKQFQQAKIDQNLENLSHISWIEKKDVNQIMMWIQVEAKAHIKQTNSPQESADYLFRLTKTIAMLPYKKDNAFSNFCAESIPRPKTREDTWINQLMQINGISYGIAKSISYNYPTFASLYQAYENEGITDKRKSQLLMDLQRVDLQQGRKIGETLSNRIYRLFCETDGTKLIQDL